PTILSLAGVSPPEERYGGRPVEAMTGRDLTPILSGSADRVYGAGDAIGYELAGHGVLFEGDYKLVINQPPVGDAQWRLFNIVTDPGETADLAALEPLRFQRMLARYQQYRDENRVLELATGDNPRQQIVLNLFLQYRDAAVVVLLTMLLLLPFLVAYRMKRKSDQKPLA
ncbi:MAG TPA: arylsulfatase, partial [Deltaproteobacteria bacterium]|nr:arylsulfatase [Deltaproteobacteria bacterium]